MSDVINDKLPIYMQIVQNFQTDILTGRLQADEPLPSIRVLAKNMNVSLVTAKKAYDTMDELGLVYTIAGKGTFVNSQNIETIRENKMPDLEKQLTEIINDAKNSGISKDELIELIKLL